MSYEEDMRAEFPGVTKDIQDTWTLQSHRTEFKLVIYNSPTAMGL
jgi:hypothetical protein